jgi:hypothetical protein
MYVKDPVLLQTIQCEIMVNISQGRNDIKHFFGVLIDLIIGFLGLIIKAFDNQTEIWA